MDGNGQKAWESSGTGGGIQRRLCSDQGEEWGGRLFRDGGFLEKGCLYFLYSYLRENSSRPIILMGGGTGFAPLKGILEHAFHIGVTRPMHLFWGVRKQEDLYLDEQPRDWAKEHSHFQYTPVLSEPKPDWQGETGFVHQTVLAHYPDLHQSEVYMSGPPKMIDSGRELFLQHGLTMDYLYSDAFEFNSHPGIGLEE